MLDQFATLTVFASLHTADPGVGGTSEVSGGGYARVTLGWAAASAGAVASNVELSFSVPAGTITHLGYWSAGGVYRGSRPLDTSQTYTTGGLYLIAAGGVVETLT